MAVVAAFPGGREHAALRLGVDLKRFDNQLYENAGHRPLSDEQVRQLELVAGTTLLPDYIAGLYTGVFSPLPEGTELENLDLYSLSLATDVAEGKVDQIIAKALDDGRIQEHEIADIIAAHRAHIAARQVEVDSVLALHSKQAGGEQ